MKTDRIQSVDVFRLLAIIAVISIHTTPFGEDREGDLFTYLHVLINQGARFAVPFFFIISGYFYAMKIRDGGAIGPVTTGMLKRLGSIWLFFTAIYVFPFDIVATFEHGLLGPVKAVFSNLANIVDQPVQFVFEGTRVHLWFLTSLACSVLITALFLKFVRPNPLPYLLAFSVVLLFAGLLGKSYSATPIGIEVDFNTRNGPFFSTICFVTGYLLSYAKPSEKYFFYGFLILLLGYAIHFGEVHFLWARYGVFPTEHDYVAGTLLLGLGVAMMALSGHRFVNFKGASSIGKYVLGIYGIHLIFVDLLRGADQQLSNHVWEIAYVLIVLALSIGATLLLARNRRMKRMLA